MLSLHDGGESFYLVGSDEVDARFYSGAPAFLHRFARTEVIVGVPTVFLAFLRRVAVESVEPHRVSQLVRIIDERAQTLGVGCRPVAGLSLPAEFHGIPGAVPPAP